MMIRLLLVLLAIAQAANAAEPISPNFPAVIRGRGISAAPIPVWGKRPVVGPANPAPPMSAPWLHPAPPTPEMMVRSYQVGIDRLQRGGIDRLQRMNGPSTDGAAELTILREKLKAAESAEH